MFTTYHYFPKILKQAVDRTIVNPQRYDYKKVHLLIDNFACFLRLSSLLIIVYILTKTGFLIRKYFDDVKDDVDFDHFLKIEW